MLVILVGRQVMLAKVMPKIMDIYKEQKALRDALETNLQIKELVV
jgi:hypothetical protein